MRSKTPYPRGMSSWPPPSLPHAAPLYLEIADCVADAIRGGHLRPGDRLPTHRDLARRLGVNVVTVTRGYAEAARRGLVDGEVGRGTFVREHSPNLEPIEPTPPGIVDLAFNLPVGDDAQVDVPGMLRELLDDPDALPVLAGYTAAGLPEHRAAGAWHLERSGVQADVERVLVTGGAQHAMTLALSALAEPGDLVLAEELTYPGLHALASVLNLRLQGVPMDREGPLPDALDEICRRHRPKAFYVMPTVHNPVGSIASAERRAALAEVARHHGLPLVEDDTYAFQCPDPPPPLASFAPELTTFVSSLSKSFTAGLRAGFLLVPASDSDGSSTHGLTAEALAGRVAAFGWMASPVTAELAARWIRDGTVERMAAWKRQEAVARRALFDEIFPDVRLLSAPCSAHVWLELSGGWKADAFVGHARRQGVAVAPAQAFSVGRGPVPEAVRICVGTPPTRDDTVRGLQILRRILDSPPDVDHALV